MVEIRQASRHIFQNDNCGFGLADDPSNVGPEIPGVSLSFALSGGGEGLAREARSHAIHDPTPGVSVEGAEVGPEGGMIQPSVVRAP